MKRLFALLLAMACAVGLSGCGEKSGGAVETLPLGQGVYDALRDEWEAFDGLSTEQRALSGRLPGYCHKGFENWTACEKFLGIDIPNPLDGDDSLERGSYVGMPEGFQDAPCVRAEWCGNRDGNVEQLSVQCGYMCGGLRVTLDARMYAGHGHSHSHGSCGSTPVISEDSGERYCASSACLTQGNIQYNLRVIGDPGTQSETREVLEELLANF